ncbi:MAG: hypothetical protein ACKVT2_21475 [Saprospiraceae bacterium]
MRLYIWLSLISFNLLCASLTAQTTPRFTKTEIADSGCKIYLPGKAGNVEVTYSPDSSVVYTMETIDTSTGSEYHFGCIVVNLNGVDLAGMEEEMLIGYMDYLKSGVNVTEAAGYGKGHTLSTHPSAKGVLDYWVDANNLKWVVKGWAAESTIFVMFVYGQEDYPNYNVVDIFFKGARFKGD